MRASWTAIGARALLRGFTPPPASELVYLVATRIHEHVVQSNDRLYAAVRDFVMPSQEDRCTICGRTGHCAASCRREYGGRVVQKSRSVGVSSYVQQHGTWPPRAYGVG